MKGPGARLAVLLGVFALPVVIVGLVLDWVFHGGWLGAVIVLIVAAAVTGAAYRGADRVILAVSGARPADEDAHPRLYNLVEGLAVSAGVPHPRLYVVDDEVANASTFGSSPERAVIVVTTGLLEKLNRIELEAVLAQQISRIRDEQLGLDTVAVTTGGAALLVTDLALGERPAGRSGAGGLRLPAVVGYPFLVLAPLSAWALRHAVSPDRDQTADLTGVGITRYPPGLIAALTRIRDDGSVPTGGIRATAHLWFQDPLPATPTRTPARGPAPFLGIHPPLEQRIERLREL